MPEGFGFKEKLMHLGSEFPLVDRGLQKRAEWVINETGIENFLKQNGKYLDIGTGKGHITQRVLEDMTERGTPLQIYTSIDIADKPLRRVQQREKKRQEGLENAVDTKNPMNFVWAEADALPFKNSSLDGVSFIFALHHMPKDTLSKVLQEANRVTKEDGMIFIVEDLVDSEEQRKITEEVDRKLNWESKDEDHSYNSDQGWRDYFAAEGLKVMDKNFFDSESGVKHGFYVLNKKKPELESV